MYFTSTYTPRELRSRVCWETVVSDEGLDEAVVEGLRRLRVAQGPQVHKRRLSLSERRKSHDGEDVSRRLRFARALLLSKSV